MSHPRSTNTSDPESEAARVFVGGVPPGADQDALEKMFEKHGKIKGVSVFKGFAFVQYDKRDEAEAAIKEENGKEFQGNRIEVKFAKRGANKGKDSGGGGGGNDDQSNDQGRPPMREPQPYPPGGGGGRGGRGGQRGRGGYGRGGYDGGGRGGGYVPAPPRGVYGGYDDNGPGGYGGRGGYGGPGGGRGGRFGPDGGPGGGPPGKQDRRNDCEIVCVSRHQRSYAEVIEGRLKNFGLKIDVLFPNPDIPLPKILGNIASRGVLFAIVVTPLNEDHKSMTVNILQGPTPQEHRNMPYDDAIALLAKTFEQSGGGGGLGGGPTERVVGPNDEVPNDIRTCIGFLMDQRPLSVMEYDKLIKYFAQRREAVLKQEYGDNIPADLAQPPIGPPVDPATKAKQNELNERILAILNKPKPKPSGPSSQIGAGPSTSGGGSGLNSSLQMAIDNLIRTGPNLLNQVQASTSGYSGAGGGGEQYGHYGYD